MPATVLMTPFVHGAGLLTQARLLESVVPIVAGSTVIMLVGLIEDKFGLSALTLPFLYLMDLVKAIKAWNPDRAPHMMTMHTNGQTVPELLGPPPAVKYVVAGIFSVGWATKMPTAVSIAYFFLYPLPG